MNQKELLEMANEHSMKALENVALAKKNEKSAVRLLQKAGQTYRVAAQILDRQDRYAYIHVQLQPYQETFLLAERKTAECIATADRYRNLLEAAEISIAEYVK
jgi:hypothetical protein